MNKLQELIGDRIEFVDTVEDWQEGIRLSAKGLLSGDYIDSCYVDAMVDAVKNLGPYMVLTDGLVMPHSRPENGVKNMGMAFLKVSKGVFFPETQVPVTLFFTLASLDSESHLEAMMKLAEIADDAQKRKQLENVTTKEEFIKIIS